MALTYTPSTYNGEKFEELFSEIILGNKTTEKGLVRLLTGIKYKQTVSTLSGDLAIQKYTSGAPTKSGDLKIGDAEIEPVKCQVYDEFDPDQLRQTWASREMSAGAANIEADKTKQAILSYAVKAVGRSIEKTFWSGITQATKDAIANAGNAGATNAREKSWASAKTGKLVGEVDGVVAKMVYDGGAVDVINVTGTTLSASNIEAEMGKFYAALPEEFLENADLVAIYAPYKVESFIRIANSDSSKPSKAFEITGSVIKYNGITIEFVPLDANVMIAGVKEDFVLGTDLTADYGQLETNKVANNQDMEFIKGVFTLCAAVVVPSQKVLYI